ncbi:MAG: hypothetical protein ACLSAP_07490 [Oscillospiraceae bacterium]
MITGDNVSAAEKIAAEAASAVLRCCRTTSEVSALKRQDTRGNGRRRYQRRARLQRSALQPAGTDAASESAGIILMKDDLRDGAR